MSLLAIQKQKTLKPYEPDADDKKPGLLKKKPTNTPKQKSGLAARLMGK